MLRIYALYGVLFTGQNNLAVHQNGQISGMPATILVLYEDTIENTKIKEKNHLQIEMQIEIEIKMQLQLHTNTH